jgi:hypothetical protein
MEGTFHLHLVGVGQNAIWGWGENRTFHHLGETGNELKLTNFQGQSGIPKSSILVSKFVLWAVGAGLLTYQLLAGPLQRTCPQQRTHPTKESLGSNTMNGSLPKAV